MNKYQRYRQKCISEGRCPHCGKPCAPYFECAERREYKRFNYYLGRMVRAGLLSQTKRKTGNLYKMRDSSVEIVFYDRHTDKRNLPRIGKKYLDIENMILQIFKDSPNRSFSVADVDELILLEATRLKRETCK